MNNEQRLEELFNIPRMGHAALEPHNSVRGLHELIKAYFNPEFVMAEIGSFQGVSTMLFAMHVKTIYSVDCYDYIVPPTGRIPSMDELLIGAEKLFLERTADINAWKNKIKSGGILCGHDFYLPHIYTILYEENLINDLVTYPDSSWSVIIK